MKNFAITLSLVLNIILASSLGYLIYKDNKYISPELEKYQTFANTLKFYPEFINEKKLSDEYFANASTEVKNIKLNGWIPYWGAMEGLKSFEAKTQEFDTINPVYYEMQPDGTLLVNKTGLSELKSILRNKKTKLVPTIAGFDAEAFSTILNDSDKLKRHIDFLINEVDENNFDGIDLDYESILLDDKDEFYSLVDSLSTQLKARGKLLSITVLSKWGDNIEYGFAPQTREVQDYTELSKYADQFRIMTYDFTSQGSLTSGPIAPIGWIEDVLDYAVKRVPKEKLILGIHLYGYSWEHEKAGIALDYRDISELKLNNKTIQLLENSIDKESAIKYISSGKEYFGYYASPETIQSRIEIAAKYGINGVSFWRLGSDGF